MPESQWDEQLKRFLKKTGEELKRAGTDIRLEAQRLMKEVRDPEKQAKVKEGLRDLGVMARKAAEEVATAVEAGVKKAEEAFKPKPGPAGPDRGGATPSPAPTEAAPRQAKPAGKSIGGKRRAGAKPKTTKSGKTIGRKQS